MQIYRCGAKADLFLSYVCFRIWVTAMYVVLLAVLDICLCLVVRNIYLSMGHNIFKKGLDLSPSAGDFCPCWGLVLEMMYLTQISSITISLKSKPYNVTQSLFFSLFFQWIWLNISLLAHTVFVLLGNINLATVLTGSNCGGFSDLMTQVLSLAPREAVRSQHGILLPAGSHHMLTLSLWDAVMCLHVEQTHFLKLLMNMVLIVQLA